MSDALSGLKVLDFGWVAAVPILTLQLAQHGAEVIRVESGTRPDSSRTSAPFVDEARTVSGAFAQINVGKKSLGLNLKHPDSREVLFALAAWADVVTENFRPGTLDRLGYGYEALAAANPRLVMLRSSSAGQTGPWSTMGATGDLLQSLCGFTYLTGFPDAAPIPPWGAWTDITVPPLGVATILAAVRKARRTGRGAHLDMSQQELSLGFLTDVIIRAQLDSAVPTRSGNQDDSASPHGLFRCAGDDAWVAITAFDDQQWERLAHAIGRPDLAAAHPTMSARVTAREVIAAAIGAWTASGTAPEVMRALQSAGVPAGVVQDAREVRQDPQLAARAYFGYADDAQVGRVLAPAAAYTLSETPLRIRRGAPALGEHSWEVLTDTLGIPEDRAAELLVGGAVE